MAQRRLAKAAAATTATINHVKKDADQLAIAALIIGARGLGVPGAELFSRRRLAARAARTEAQWPPPATR